MLYSNSNIENFQLVLAKKSSLCKEFARSCDTMDTLNRITTYKNASIAAYCVAALNIIPVLLIFIFGYFLSSSSAMSSIGSGTLSVLVILLSTVAPILTLIVVRMLPCNQVARICGYGAQVIFFVSIVTYYAFASTNVPII